MPTKLDSERYIYPPRPHTCIPRTELDEFGKMGWIAQLKYNDSRALVKYLDNDKVELWTRHAERFKSYTAPDWLIRQLLELKSKLGITEWSILDGGLLNSKHESIRDTVVIWDILVLNSEYLVGTQYQERYSKLYELTNVEPWYYHPPHKQHGPLQFGFRLDHNLFVPGNFPYAPEYSTWDGLWKMIDTVNAPYLVVSKGPVLEGLVVKNPHGELSRAWKEQNNGDWMTRSRVETGRHRF